MAEALIPAIGMPEFTVIATSPKDMEAGQQSLIGWAAEKIKAVKQELEGIKADRDLAVKNKWRVSGWNREIGKCQKRLEFFEKIKAALDAGYFIVPPFPVEIFAIRTNKTSQNPYASDYRNNRDQKADILPIGEGRYVDPTPVVMVDSHTELQKDGKSKEIKEYYADEFREVDFPFKLAGSEVIGATARAMALKIFDRFGVLPATKRKPDPIVVGQVIVPNKVRYRWRDDEAITFFVAWWLDTRSMPE